MSRAFYSFVGLIFVFLLIAAIVAGYLANEFYFRSGEGEAKNFVVQPGENVKEIAERLEQAGIISNDSVFRIYVRWTGVDRNFQTGAFALKPGTSMAALATALTAPEACIVRATIIEGWTIRDIGFYFENKAMFQAEEIFEQAGLQAVDYRTVDIENPAEKWQSEFEFLSSKPDYISLEGYLFPDTYYFFEDVTAEGAVRRMLENFDRKMKPEWREEIARQGKTIFEIITMASIIEREMYGLEARKMVSDIFWKRLEIGMPLQSDASVNYVTGKKTARPSIDDTRVDSPYNTYKYPGLPLGPISNPSSEAIEAAIYPAPNEYYYFLTTPEGEIIYSKDHDEHVRNKQKYLN